MTSKPVIFRKMDLDTISDAWIHDVGCLVIELAEELKLNYCTETIHRHVDGLIRNKTGELYCVFAGTEMVGMMGLVYNPDIWNSEDITATEVSWYVKPANRGLTGMRFIKYVEQNINCAKIRLGVGNILLRKMLERQGYQCTKYIMEKSFYGRGDS